MADIQSVHTLMQDYQRHITHLDRLRAMLEERLEAAEAELGRLGERPAAPDPAAHRRTAAHVRATIAKLRAAMARLDRGLYGTCRRCGGFIPLDQLVDALDVLECAPCRESHRDQGPPIGPKTRRVVIPEQGGRAVLD
ncbi:hypothetical protein Sme01_64960 [Sphaerisporangium melleum]|uniref:DksA C4-type domain-containing protein n=1 Tax=Sphaerisporangium melleum TaxID=321316 RepID=A0A917RDY4_9ACTN|nr:hypothetical protein [Sphaerisporangium melleum]GGL03792.1 hypothetical protein GCM10007964_52350 [Sphaerisporangium melleum]GII74020.1 hypothetical protein Sme01_64960 [Sphaerisporangium melleum]